MAAVAPSDVEVPPVSQRTVRAAAGAIAGDPYAEPGAPILLGVLCFAHFFNDFCLGISAPMIPSLEVKFGLTLGAVASIVTVLAICSNLSQPIAGWFMDRSRGVKVLFVTPLVSSLTLLTGLVAEPWQAGALFLIAGAAVGAFHPYALVVAQRTLPGRPTLATSIFISFGFLGVSTGSMVSGIWMEARGFEAFHYLSLLSLLIVAAVAFARLDRLRLADYRGAHRALGEASHRARRTVPFALLYVMGFLVAFESGSLLFFVPKLFKDLYGSEGLGGKANFAFGLLGGLCSYFYAYLSDRGSPYRVGVVTQFIALPALIGFFYFADWPGKVVMMALVGMTAGGMFAILASLAREARGLTLGLRSALMLGGVWGVVSIVNLFVARVTDYGIELEHAMRISCLAPLALIPLLAFCSRRYSSR